MHFSGPAPSGVATTVSVSALREGLVALEALDPLVPTPPPYDRNLLVVGGTYRCLHWEARKNSSDRQVTRRLGGRLLDSIRQPATARNSWVCHVFWHDVQLPLRRLFLRQPPGSTLRTAVHHETVRAEARTAVHWLVFLAARDATFRATLQATYRVGTIRLERFTAVTAGSGPVVAPLRHRCSQNQRSPAPISPLIRASVAAARATCTLDAVLRPHHHL